MAQIERKALETEIVERLALLLERTKQGHEYGTTEALSFFTTLLAWVMHRVKKPDDRAGMRLQAKWKQASSDSEPWCFPEPLDNKTVFDALDDLRNASSHAGLRSSEPLNENGCLVGFKLGGTGWSIELSEDELRRVGALVARDFIESGR